MRPDWKNGDPETEAIWFDDDAPVGDADQCELCGRWTSALRSLPPYVAELEVLNGRLTDFATATGDGFAISARFVALWEAAGLTGFTGFEPIRVVRVRYALGTRQGRALVPAYVHVEVPRCRARIDEEASGAERDPDQGPVCPECRAPTIKALDRVVLAPESPPTTDVFRVRGIADVIVSPRFADWAAAHTITGFRLVPALEFSYDCEPWNKGTRVKSM